MPKIEVLPIEQGATPDESNVNKHTARGGSLLVNSLQKRGAFRSIASAGKDAETPVVYAGNYTLEKAVEAGFTEIVNVHVTGNQLVNVVRDDVAPGSPEAIALGLEDNESAKQSYNPDIDILAALAAGDNAILASLRKEDKTFSGMLEGMGLKDDAIDAEPQIDRAAELLEKWQVKIGDLWQIGEHRLLCGDSTKREDVERVMGKDKIELVWTDPPYGVAVGDKNKYLNSIAPSNRVEENLDNDTLDETGLIEMLCATFDNTIAFCTAGAGWYVAAPPGPLHVLFGQVLKERGIWRQTIQWVKNNSTFSSMGVCYHWQAEPIFFGWLPNGAHRFYGGRKQTTVWNIERPLKSPEHPTMKPVELVERAIANSSQKDEVVVDLFCGSGSTMVACQNLGRKCRAIEIEPKYCAVTLERMNAAFPDLEIKRIQ